MENERGHVDGAYAEIEHPAGRPKAMKCKPEGVPCENMNPIQQIIDAIDRDARWESECALTRGELLKPAGTCDSRVFFVREGCLRVFVDDGHEEHTIRFGYRNNFITSLDCFITDLPSDLAIEALRKTTVSIISRHAYLEVIEQNGLDKVWQEVLHVLVLQMMERERDLLTASPSQRYERVLARSPQLFQEVPHKYIAAYLRMTPETLSRLKKS